MGRWALGHLQVDVEGHADGDGGQHIVHVGPADEERLDLHPKVTRAPGRDRKNRNK